MLPSPMNPIRAMGILSDVTRISEAKPEGAYPPGDTPPDVAEFTVGRAFGATRWLIRLRSLKRLDQISNQVRARGRVGHSGERHAVAGHDRLRIGDELVERLLAPGDAAPLQRRRIAE